ncbi:MAG: tetratricopeptide repeat protein [Bacteroidetes bacterium]|nr:tetratricopeptide repeat protein [Bacteroidota bacterium]
MNFIKEIYHSMIFGWHEGKGHKNTRKGNFEKALEHYSTCLKYSDNDDGVAIIIECIARTHARLNNFDEALKQAEKSLELLGEFENTVAIFDESKKRVKLFIEILKTKDKEAINKHIAI